MVAVVVAGGDDSAACMCCRLAVAAGNSVLMLIRPSSTVTSPCMPGTACMLPLILHCRHQVDRTLGRLGVMIIICRHELDTCNDAM